MTIPIGAILAGLGRGASELGDRMDRNEALRRQRAMDALNEAVTFRKMGARVLRPDETDTDAFVASPASQAVGRARTPDAIAALVNQGVQPDQNQTVTAQLPDPVTGATRNIFIDPTQSDDARAEQRAMRQLFTTQHLIGERETANRQMDIQARREEEANQRNFTAQQANQKRSFETTTKQQERQADYNALRAEFKQHPASQQPFDANTDYAAILKDQQELRKLDRAQKPTAYFVSPTDPKKPVMMTKEDGMRLGLTPWLPGANQNNSRARAAYQGKLGEVATAERTLKNATDAVEANPNAFGLKNKLPDIARQRLPGASVDAGTIGALEYVVGELRHGRFGGALSELEANKAARIFSEPSSPPDVILAQLKEIGKAIKMRRDALGEAYGADAAPDAPAAPSPTGPKTVTVNGRTYIVK